MADKIESKKEHLEGILGEKVNPEALALIPLFMDVAISTETPCTITQQSLIVFRPNRCFESRAFDISGFTQTRANGQSVFRLSNFRCPQGEIYSAPINVVATPISPKPFFLTVMQALVNNGTDVEITVFSWDANGAPAPNVAFNWRCRVEHATIIT
jgi:hypothetical protein